MISDPDRSDQTLAGTFTALADDAIKFTPFELWACTLPIAQLNFMLCQEYHRPSNSVVLDLQAAIKRMNFIVDGSLNINAAISEVTALAYNRSAINAEFNADGRVSTVLIRSEREVEVGHDLLSLTGC